MSPHAEPCFTAGALAETSINGYKSLGKRPLGQVPAEIVTFLVIFYIFYLPKGIGEKCDLRISEKVEPNISTSPKNVVHR